MKNLMSRPLFVAALAAFVLGACAHHRYKAPDPRNPQVSIAPTGQLVLNQEPIVITLNRGQPTPITWRLPQGLSFDPTIGIRILGRIKNEDMKPIPIDDRFNRAFNCGPGEKAPPRTQTSADQRRATTSGAQAFTCDIDPDVPQGLYSYEVNAIGPNGRIQLDPSIMPLKPR